MVMLSKCWNCNTEISPERIEFLLELGVAERDLSCLKHSQITRIKGIYSGENGTSDIILCSKVYNDSVRSKFTEEEVVEPNEELDK